MIILIAFILAFCSFGYNFIFSHLLGITLGATIIQYCLGLGLYVFSLGLGSIIFDYIPNRKDFKFLIKIETLICLLAFTGSFWIVLIDFGARHYDLLHLSLLAYLPTILLGFLSGMELPFLLNFTGYRSSRWVIMMDYIGMAVMCVFIGFFAVPHLGFFLSLQFCIMMNAIAILCFASFNKAITATWGLGYFVFLCVLSFLLPWEQWIRGLFVA